MKRSIILYLIAFSLVTLLSCSEKTRKEEIKPKTDFEQFKDSFKEFQSAVARGNINEIAEHISFPLGDPFAEDISILFTQYNKEDWSVEKTYPNTKEGFLSGGYELLFQAKARKARGENTDGYCDLLDDRFLNIKKIVLDKQIQLQKTDITIIEYQFLKSDDNPHEYILEFTFKNIDKNDPDFGLQNGMLFYFGKVDSNYKLTKVFLGS